MVVRQCRARERGAALFIVVLVVVLLGAIGVFAVRVTSLAQVASGYSRRAATAFYLGEVAMNTVAADMSSRENHYNNSMLAGNDCRMTAGLKGYVPSGSAVPCYSMDPSEIRKRMVEGNSALGSDPEGLLGALVRPDSPTGASLIGNFRLEMTDPGPGGVVAGMAAPGGKVQTSWVWLSAFTVTGRVMPDLGTNECDVDATRSSESQTLRAYVRYTSSSPPTGSPP